MRAGQKFIAGGVTNGTCHLQRIVVEHSEMQKKKKKMAHVSLLEKLPAALFTQVFQFFWGNPTDILARFGVVNRACATMSKTSKCWPVLMSGGRFKLAENADIPKLLERLCNPFAFRAVQTLLLKDYDPDSCPAIFSVIPRLQQLSFDLPMPFDTPITGLPTSLRVLAIHSTQLVDCFHSIASLRASAALPVLEMLHIVGSKDSAEPVMIWPPWAPSSVAIFHALAAVGRFPPIFTRVYVPETVVHGPIPEFIVRIGIVDANLQTLLASGVVVEFGENGPSEIQYFPVSYSHHSGGACSCQSAPPVMPLHMLRAPNCPDLPPAIAEYRPELVNSLRVGDVFEMWQPGEEDVLDDGDWETLLVTHSDAATVATTCLGSLHIPNAIFTTKSLRELFSGFCRPYRCATLRSGTDFFARLTRSVSALVPSKSV